MKLRRIRIERLAGISEGFSLENLSAGINVIVGPNASGKTSICRAIRALLYPGQHIDGPVWLEAEFDGDDGRLLKVLRQGRELRWECDGESIEPPPVTDERLAGCYTVELPDLLASATTDGAIAERVALDISGGYDIQKVQRELTELRRNHAKAEREKLWDADRELSRLLAGHGETRRREDELGDLAERLDEAKQAAADAEACRRALDLLAAARELAEREAKLAEFPEAVSCLHGDERDELSAIRRKCSEARQRLAEAERSIQALQTTLEGNGLQDSDTELADLAEARAWLETLRSIEQRRMQLEENLAKAESRQASTLEQLAGRKPDAGVRVTPEALRQVEEDLVRKREVEGEIGAVKSELGRLPAVRTERGEIEHLATARGELLRWLAAPTPRATVEMYVWIALLSLSAVAGLTGAAIWWRPIVALGVLPVVVAAVAALRNVRARATEGKQARQRFLETEVEAPAAWTPPAVRERLDAIDSELTEAKAGQAATRRRVELENALRDLESRRVLANQELEALAVHVGFDPRHLDASFERWLRLVGDYDGARCEVVELRAALGEHRVDEQSLHEKLSGFLAAFDPSAIEDAADTMALGLRFERIDDLVRKRDEARRDLAEHERLRDRTGNEIAQLRDDLARIFARAGVAVDEDAALEQQLALREPWKLAGRDRDSARGKVEQAAAVLGDRPDLLDLVDRDDEQALRALLGERERAAGDIEEYTRRIAEIEKEIADARAGDRLACARADRQQAADALRDRLEEEWLASSGSVLLERVAQEHASESRPAVLLRAAEWFARFSRHAFRLEFEPESGFAAYDEVSGERRGLDELSSGTRMQLLLAVRLAFALEVERGRESLPFFIDEALTTADPERFEEVASAIAEMVASDDRQVFYMTAQPEEAERWKRAAKGAPALVDLAAVRQLESSYANAGEIRLPERPVVPDPAGCSAEDYAVKIGAGKVRPFEPIGCVHAFYMLRDDLPLLAKLVGAGIERAGQVEALLASRAADVLLDPSERAGLERRLAVLRAFAAAWSEGRGRPVDRNVLEAAGVSRRVIDRVGELCADLAGDAAKLVGALEQRQDPRAKNFQSRSLEQLRDYLEREGYLDDRPRLDGSAIGLRVLAALAGAGETDPADNDFILARVSDLRAAYPD